MCILCFAGSACVSDLVASGVKLALLIHEEWADKILTKGKTYEMRSRSCNVRGKIALLSSGKILGVCEVTNSFEVSDKWKKNNAHLHQIEDKELLKKYNHAWHLEHPEKFGKPITCARKQSVQVWQRLDSSGSLSIPSEPASTVSSAPTTVATVGAHVLRCSFRYLLDRCFLHGRAKYIVLPNTVSKWLWLGDNSKDLIWGKMELDEPENIDGRLPDMTTNPLALRCEDPSVKLRCILNVMPLCRTVGDGSDIDLQEKKKGYVRTQQGWLETVDDVTRLQARSAGRNAILHPDELPDINLQSAAHHFMEAIPMHFYRRLEMIARALDGARVRLATTCSGLETMPSVLSAVFRWDTYIHTYIHTYVAAEKKARCGGCYSLCMHLHTYIHAHFVCKWLGKKKLADQQAFIQERKQRIIENVPPKCMHIHTYIHTSIHTKKNVCNPSLQGIEGSL